MSIEKDAPEKDTRERLIAAATQLFAQKGFDGTSVKELADAAGVNVSLISYHFGGKENLYRATLQQFGEGRLAVAQRMLQKPQSAEEFRLRLQSFIEEMFTCHFENREVIQILHRECDMNTPIAQDLFRETFMKVFATLVGFFEAAQNLKLIRQDLDASLLAQFFFGMIKHLTQSDELSVKFHGHSIRDLVYREKVVAQAVSFCIYGCAADQRSPV